jgi:hypothetical protein
LDFDGGVGALAGGEGGAGSGLRDLDLGHGFSLDGRGVVRSMSKFRATMFRPRCLQERMEVNVAAQEGSPR